MEILKDISEFSLYRPSSGDLLKLFQIVTQQNLSREQAAERFKSDSYFRRVNKKLKDRLLDGLLLNSFSQLSKVQQQHFTIRKRSLEMTMLLQSGKKKAAIKIGEETLQSANKYGLIDIALKICRSLEDHYSVSEFNPTKRNKYVTQNKLFQRYFNEECQAQSTYNEIAYSIQKKCSLNHVPAMIDALSEKLANNEQYRFRLYYYSAKNLYHQHINDKSAFINTCQEAIYFFSNISYILPYTTQWSFQFDLIQIYLAQQEYSRAEITINKILHYPNPGSYNWHLTLCYKVVLGLYSQKPNIAMQAWNEAKTIGKTFNSKGLDDYWRVVEAYLALFNKLGRLSCHIPFRLYKFLNEVTTTRKIQLLEIELLHLLVGKKKGKYMDKVDQIPTFIQKHKPNERSIHFLRMLAAVESADYHPIRVKAHAAEHLNLLKKVPMGEMDVNVFDTELVRYEVLWDFILAFLDRR